MNHRKIGKQFSYDGKPYIFIKRLKTYATCGKIVTVRTVLLAKPESGIIMSIP